MDTRITIVGCGAVVENLYKVPLRRLERQGALSVVGLVDIDINRAWKMQSIFPKASVHDNVIDAIKESSSNLTIVASPVAFHAEQSILALKHNNHVLCEKPMAVGTEQCNQMIETAHEFRRILAIGMPRRFYPSFTQAKQIIRNGQLGDLLSFSYQEGQQFGWPVATPAGFSKSLGGGGVLFDIGSHVFDILIWLFGKLSITGYFDDAIGGVEANCLIQICSSNCSGSVQLSCDTRLNNELRITGTIGEVVVGIDRIDKISSRKSGTYFKTVPDVGFPIDLRKKDVRLMTPKIYPECIFLQLVQVIRAIQMGEGIPVTAEEGREVISLMEDCYRTTNPIDMKWLPPGQNETFKKIYRRNRQ